MKNFPSPPLDSSKKLAIMIILERKGCVIFSDLYKVMKMTRGALDSHLRSLIKFQYIYKEVRFVNTNSRVLICPTPEGLVELKVAKGIWHSILDLD